MEAFYAKYRDSNENLRRRFFPDRATLFDEDFSSYPEAEDPRDVTPADFAAIAAQLHAAAVAESRRLEAEIAIRDARLHWTRNEAGPAEQALRRALRWCPDHAAAHRTLAEYLFRLDRLRRGDRSHASRCRHRARKAANTSTSSASFSAAPATSPPPPRPSRVRSSSTPATPPRATSSSRC